MVSQGADALSAKRVPITARKTRPTGVGHEEYQDSQRWQWRALHHAGGELVRLLFVADGFGIRPSIVTMIDVPHLVVVPYFRIAVYSETVSRL